MAAIRGVPFATENEILREPPSCCHGLRVLHDYATHGRIMFLNEDNFWRGYWAFNPAPPGVKTQHPSFAMWIDWRGKRT